MYFLWYLLIGLIVVYIASLIVKGSGSGLLLNIVIRYCRRVLGGWLLSLFRAGRRRDAGQPDRVARRGDRVAVDRFAAEP